jgi:hypothetical protein
LKKQKNLKKHLHRQNFEKSNLRVGVLNEYLFQNLSVYKTDLV